MKENYFLKGNAHCAPERCKRNKKALIQVIRRARWVHTCYILHVVRKMLCHCLITGGNVQNGYVGNDETCSFLLFLCFGKYLLVKNKEAFNACVCDASVHVKVKPNLNDICIYTQSYLLWVECDEAVENLSTHTHTLTLYIALQVEYKR